MKFFSLLTIFSILSSSILHAQVSDRKGDKYFEKLIDSTRGVLRSHKYKDAITLSSQLIEDGTKYKSNEAVFIGYDILGTVYTNLQDSTKARINSEKALESAITAKNDSLIAWGNLNLGNVYSDRKNSYEKAITFFKRSLDYYIKNKDAESQYLCYVNIGWTLLNQNQYDKAYTYLRRAKALEEKTDIFKDYVLFNKLMFGKYYYYKKDYDIAEKLLSDITKQIDKDSILHLGKESYHFLTKVHEKKGNYLKAFNSLQKEKYYGEVNHEDNRLNAIEVASAKFDLKEYKKDLEIAIKEKENQEKLTENTRLFNVILFIAIGVLLLALLGFFLLFRSRKKFVKKLSEKNKELTRSKNKTEKLSKVKTQFFSTVSHELRTPLYGVIGISSILQEDIKLKSYQEELNSLKFSADYLLALINDVLLLNKMDNQELILEKVPFKLSTLVASITRSFEYSLQQNKNKLIVNIDDEVPNSLLGSSVRISQILMNLIGNATKFNENGRIWLIISSEGTTKDGLCKIKFIIKDDGIGIPESKQAMIFEEFSQVENDNYSHKGTGLGLPITKKLLQLHNSDIVLKSELGKGSEFSFVLSLEENQTKEIFNNGDNCKVETIGEEPPMLYEGVHVLVVDDNKINQKVTQRMLEKNDIKSSVANDGEEAVEMVKNNNYNLILMDINMPKLNGIEATKIIRTFNKEIPIIALTAVEIEEMRAEILDSGMNGILCKPYDASQFLTTILKNLAEAKSKTI